MATHFNIFIFIFIFIVISSSQTERKQRSSVANIISKWPHKDRVMYVLSQISQHICLFLVFRINYFIVSITHVSSCVRAFLRNKSTCNSLILLRASDLMRSEISLMCQTTHRIKTNRTDIIQTEINGWKRQKPNVKCVCVK